MNFPETLKYTKSHEWAKIEGNQVTVGITEHAQKELGDVVFVDLPAVGRTLKKGETFGAVESIKAVSDLYSPVSGKVVAINEILKAEPATVNHDSYGKGWMVRLEFSDSAAAADASRDLLDPATYTTLVGNH